MSARFWSADESGSAGRTGSWRAAEAVVLARHRSGAASVAASARCARCADRTRRFWKQ
jgi:hypothetical protein